MKAYDQALKRRVIEDFVKENDRSPTQEELRVLFDQAKREKPNLNIVGFSGYDVSTVQFGAPGSAQVENANRRAVLDDLRALNKHIDGLFVSLEDSFRGFMTNAYRLNRILSGLEGRANTLLLQANDPDVFVSSIEETFESQEKIDFVNSTVSVENQQVLLPKKHWSEIPLDTADVRVYAQSVNKIINQSATQDLSALFKPDGKVWEYLVYTSVPGGRTSLFIDIAFPDPVSVTELRISGLPIAVNHELTGTLFYSTNGSTFEPLEPVERPITQTQVSFPVGLDNVHSLRLRLSKLQADTTTTNRRQHVWTFMLDGLQVFNNTYRRQRGGELICGPYTPVARDGSAIAFTKAKLTACCVKPAGTSINWQVSNDGSTWRNAGSADGETPVVSFGNNAPGVSAGYHNASAPVGALIASVVGLEDISQQTEAVLNVFVDQDYVSKVPIEAVAIKRNVPSSSTLDGVPSGWVREADGMLSCWIEVESFDGVDLDFGTTTAFINDRPVTGKTHIPQGSYRFKTSRANWYELPTGLASVDEFRLNDPLYPFNHRYLIEGYVYSGAHVGARPYVGVDDYYGILMQYVTPEAFNLLVKTDPRFYRAFTILNVNGNLVMKVKVDKSKITWSEELFDTDWILQDGPSTALYVKAILNSINPAVSPVINSFSAQVV